MLRLANLALFLPWLAMHMCLYIQVDLFWRRAIGDPGFKRVFCLAHAEKLTYHVCEVALQLLQELSQGKQSQLVFTKYDCIARIFREVKFSQMGYISRHFHYFTFWRGRSLLQ